jgi:hypothetical protein
VFQKNGNTTKYVLTWTNAGYHGHVINGNVAEAVLAHDTLKHDPERGCRRDGCLRHVPVVAGVPAQTPDFSVIAALPDVYVQGADAAAVHVRPEPEAEGTVGVRSRKLLGDDPGNVVGPAGRAGVDEGKCTSHPVGGEAGVVADGASVGIVASAALKWYLLFISRSSKGHTCRESCR